MVKFDQILSWKQAIKQKKRREKMKKMALMFTLLLLFFVVGCGSSGAPECSSKDVQKMVLQIVTEQFQNKFTSQTIMTEFGIDPSLWGNPTYDSLKQQMKQGTAEEKSKIETIIRLVDKQLSSFSLSLEGTRTESCDDKTRKCQCGANLVIPGPNGGSKSFPIKYTAQYTDDGKIYVEVFGL